MCFDIDAYENAHFYNSDAKEFVMHETNKRYDVVVCDIFIPSDKTTPKWMNSAIFWTHFKERVVINGYLIVNALDISNQSKPSYNHVLYHQMIDVFGVEHVDKSNLPWIVTENRNTGRIKQVILNN